MAGSMGGCPIVIRYADGDGLGAALKVGADRCCKDTELIFIGRLYSNDGIASKHERTDIKGCPGTIGRNVISVGSYDLCDCVNKSFLGELRHFQSRCTVHHTLCVQIRAEGYNMAILRCVSFQALKTGLSVLENAGALT